MRRMNVILRELKDTNWEFARPLRVEELAELLALDFKAGPVPKFREDWRLEDPVEAVLSTCPMFLSLVNVKNPRIIQFFFG